MMKLFSKIHLWRWIHGHHQVIISGAFLQRWCSIFQRFISGDGNVVLVPSSLLLIRDMVNVFFNYSFTIFVNVQYMIWKKLPHRQMTGNPWYDTLKTWCTIFVKTWEMIACKPHYHLHRWSVEKGCTISLKVTRGDGSKTTLHFPWMILCWLLQQLCDGARDNDLKIMYPSPQMNLWK